MWSAFITGELVRIRVEHSIDRGVGRAVYRQRINDLIHLLSDVMHVVNYRDAEVSGLLDDADDEPILATAVVGGAHYIVSLNIRDFPVHREIGGIRFVTPQEFLIEMESRYPDMKLTEQVQQAGRQLP